MAAVITCSWEASLMVTMGTFKAMIIKHNLLWLVSHGLRLVGAVSVPVPDRGQNWAKLRRVMVDSESVKAMRGHFGWRRGHYLVIIECNTS